MLFTARPTEEQIKDIDFLLNLGELLLKKPVVNPERFEWVWQQYACEMTA